MKIGFDNEKYLKIQSEHIKERIAQFDGKLYMELGGKLFDDHHASRVLPGFKPDSKLRMLAQLHDSIEIVIVVNADDIEKNKVRADLGITYDEDVLRLRDEFMTRNFMVGSVVITHYTGQHAADQFRHRLERRPLVLAAVRWPPVSLNSIMRTSVASVLDTPSSRLSLCGTCL